MPETSVRIWELLGEKRKPAGLLTSELDFYDYQPGGKISRTKAIFPRIDLTEFISETNKSGMVAQPAPEAGAKEKRWNISLMKNLKRWI